MFYDDVCSRYLATNGVATPIVVLNAYQGDIVNNEYTTTLSQWKSWFISDTSISEGNYCSKNFDFKIIAGKVSAKVQNSTHFIIDTSIYTEQEPGYSGELTFNDYSGKSYKTLITFTVGFKPDCKILEDSTNPFVSSVKLD